MIKIGNFSLDSRVVLAPMAGVTDQPFRQLCRSFGASLTPSEMISSNVRLWDKEKSRLRRCHVGEHEPRMVQIAGSDPAMMAEAARLNVDQGAQIIDINMGCPAKKVLKRSAGSALLQYPELVEEILSAVVKAVNVPVTLKIRTGWDLENRNGVQIARLAQNCGIQSLAVHGRTRACAFKGDVEYHTIAAIKDAVSIPVFANGDINTAEQAASVLAQTNADGLMIGRAAQGQPWIFSQINHFLDTGTTMQPMTLSEIHTIIQKHLTSLHEFYGPVKGIFFARKHIAWYLAKISKAADIPVSEKELAQHIINFRHNFNSIQESRKQLDYLETIFAFLTGQLGQKQQKPHLKELAA